MVDRAQIEQNATRTRPHRGDLNSRIEYRDDATASEGLTRLETPPQARKSEDIGPTDVGAAQIIQPDLVVPSLATGDPDSGPIVTLPNPTTIHVPPPSSPSSDPLAIPSAGQPHRASSAERRSKSPVLPPSTESSSIGIVTTRSRSHTNLPPQSDPYPDQDHSDDSLRLMPMDSSATGSVPATARSRSQTRSVSPATRASVPTGEAGRLRSASPTGSPARSRNGDQIAPIESVSKAASASRSSRNKRTRSRRPPTEKEDLETSDDELALVGSSQTGPIPKRKDRRKSNFLGVDVPPPSSRTSSNSTPRASVQPSASARPSPVVSSAQSPVGGNDEIDMLGPTSLPDKEGEQKKGGVREEGLPPVSVSSSSPRDRLRNQVDPSSKHPTTREATSEGNDQRASSSPLSSAPSTTPTRQGPDDPISPSATTTTTLASKRRLPSSSSSSSPSSGPSRSRDDVDRDDIIIVDQHAATIEPDRQQQQQQHHGSPKKKARVPKVYVKPVVGGDGLPADSSSNTTTTTKTTKTTTTTKGRAKSGTGRVRTCGTKKAQGGGRDMAIDEAKVDVERGDERGSERGMGTGTSATETTDAKVEGSRGDGWAVRPKRGKSVKRSLREETSSSDEEQLGDRDGSSDDDEDDDARSERASSDTMYSSPAKKRRSATKTAVTRARGPPRASAAGKGGKKESAKGKGKGKEKARARTDDIAAAKKVLDGPVSSSAKTALHAKSSFLFDLSQSSQSRTETAQDRAKGWDVREFDDYVWVHVDEMGGKGGFWWIGRITNRLRSERPLAIELFVDPNRTILQTSPSPIIEVAQPSPENLLKFRSKYCPSALRFTCDTFRDSASATSSSRHLDEAFEAVLQSALQLESSFGDDDDTDESDGLPDPNESMSEDELMKEEDEVASFPFYCLAKEQGGWWAANCVGYADGHIAVNGAKARKASKPKFHIEYPSGHTAILPRSSLLFSQQKQFALVKIQESIVEFQPQYLANAVAFIKRICPEELQQVVDETYAPAQVRNDAFYAGGRARERLAQTSVFGELPAHFIDDISDTIEAWLLPPGGCGGGGGGRAEAGQDHHRDRPKGSARYEALTELERVGYVADVLLPVAIVLNYIDDLADGDVTIEDRVRKAFDERGESPSRAKLDVAVYEQAYRDLNSRSATKAVKSMREGRRTAQNQRADFKRAR